MFRDCNESNLHPFTRINWRASLVPAAAVIPAPIAYIKVVAVKKLVVGLLGGCQCPPCACAAGPFHPSVNVSRYSLTGFGLRYFTLRKLECFRQACAGIH
jgi:hypothetical protein